MADKSLTPIDLPELSSAPASPDSGFHRFYAKTDGKAYSKSSAGTEYDLTTGVSLTTTGTSGSATLVGTTLNIPVYQSALTNPVTGTGANTRLTYWSGTNTVTSTANMTWDATNSRMIVSGAIRSTPLSTDVFGEGIVVNLSTNVSPGGTYYIKNNANSSYLAGFGMATNDVRFANYVINGKVFFYTNNAGTGADRMQIWQNGNVLIQSGGTFTDNGQRLQVYGSTLLRGAGTTSATTALLVQNSTPTELFKVLDNGNANFNNDLTVSGVFIETVTANRQAASYTLALTDRGKLVEMDVATANNLTVPLNSSIAFPVGTKIDIVQYGAGQTTIVATGGVTLRSTNNWLKINARYGAVTLVKIATDEWYVFGNLNA